MTNILWKFFIEALLLMTTHGQSQTSQTILQIEPPKSLTNGASQPINSEAVPASVLLIENSPKNEPAVSVKPESLKDLSNLASTTELQKLINTLLQNADAAKLPENPQPALPKTIQTISISEALDPSSSGTEPAATSSNLIDNTVVVQPAVPDISAMKSLDEITASTDSRFATSPEEIIAQLGMANDPSHSTTVTAHDQPSPINQVFDPIGTTPVEKDSAAREASLRNLQKTPPQTSADIQSLIAATKLAHMADTQSVDVNAPGKPKEHKIENIIGELMKSTNVDTASAAAFRSQPVSVESIKSGQPSDIDINKEIQSIFGALGNDMVGAVGADANSIPLTSMLPHSKPLGTTIFGTDSTVNAPSVSVDDSNALQMLGLPPSAFGTNTPQSASTLHQIPAPNSQSVPAGRPNLEFSDLGQFQHDFFQSSFDPLVGNSMSVNQGIVTDTDNSLNGKQKPLTDPGKLNIPDGMFPALTPTPKNNVELSALKSAGIDNPNIGLASHIQQALQPSTDDSLSFINQEIFGPSVPQSNIADIQKSQLEHQRKLRDEQQKRAKKLAELEAKRLLDEQKNLEKILSTIDKTRTEQRQKQSEQIQLLQDRQRQENKFLFDLEKKRNEIAQKNHIDVIKQANKEQLALHNLLLSEEKKQREMNRKIIDMQAKSITADDTTVMGMEEFKRKQKIEEEKRRADFQIKLQKLRAEAAKEQKKRAEEARKRQLKLEQLQNHKPVVNSLPVGFDATNSNDDSSSSNIQSTGIVPNKPLLIQSDKISNLNNIIETNAEIPLPPVTIHGNREISSFNSVPVSTQIHANIIPASPLEKPHVSGSSKGNLGGQFIASIQQSSSDDDTFSNSIQMSDNRRVLPAIIPIRIPEEQVPIMSQKSPLPISQTNEQVVLPPVSLKRDMVPHRQPSRSQDLRRSRLEGSVQRGVSFDEEIYPVREGLRIQSHSRRPRPLPRRPNRPIRRHFEFDRNFNFRSPRTNVLRPESDFYSDLHTNSFQRRISRDWNRQLSGHFGNGFRMSSFRDRQQGSIVPYDHRQFGQLSERVNRWHRL